MKLTRLSLFYLAGYLLPSGAALLLAPDLAFKLLLSNGSYGDAFPRLVGAFIVALGILVIQFIRLRLEGMYPTIVVVRLMLISVLGWLFARTADPFFAVVAGVVGFGVALTVIGYLLDSRKGATLAGPRAQPAV
jgi:hypothetical protein